MRTSQHRLADHFDSLRRRRRERRAPTGTRQARRRTDHRPRRACLPADLAPVLLAVLPPGGPLRPRPRDERRLHRSRRLRPDPGQPRHRRPHLDGAGDRGSAARADRALRRRGRHRRRRDRRAAPGARHARGLHRPPRGALRQLPRLRAHPHRGPRGALRPRPEGARPARPLVRERHLRQAGARDRADALGARASTGRRTWACGPTPTSA